MLVAIVLLWKGRKEKRGMREGAGERYTGRVKRREKEREGGREGGRGGKEGEEVGSDEWTMRGGRKSREGKERRRTGWREGKHNLFSEKLLILIPSFVIYDNCYYSYRFVLIPHCTHLCAG